MRSKHGLSLQVGSRALKEKDVDHNKTIHPGGQ
jgi:hypothetical protein